MKHYIGLDVSMKRTFICVLSEQGKIVHEGAENTWSAPRLSRTI